MRPSSIPIRPAGTVHDEPLAGLDVLPLPDAIATFEMPAVPQPGPGRDTAGARDVMQAFVDRMGQWLAAGGDLPAFDLAGLDPAVLTVLNETLGEGEICATIADTHEIRLQETVFAGVWREQHLDGTRLLSDLLLAAPLPPIVSNHAAAHAAPALRDLPLPAGAMNVRAVLAELQDAMDRCAADPAAPAHVVNLTLLPLSPEDIAHIDALLAGGSVTLLSRGFGNCRIASTAARNVWRVQYYSNMQAVILNTIEVVSVPEVACAAREDLIETRARLAELVAWMGEGRL